MTILVTSSHGHVILVTNSHGLVKLGTSTDGLVIREDAMGWDYIELHVMNLKKETA